MTVFETIKKARSDKRETREKSGSKMTRNKKKTLAGMGLVYPSLYLFLNQKRFPTGESFYGERAKPRTEGELQDLSPTVILRQFT